MSPKHKARRKSRHHLRAAGIAAAAVTAVAVGAVAVVNGPIAHAPSGMAAAAATTPDSRSTSTASITRQNAGKSPAVAVPLRVVSVAPDHARALNGATPIVIRFDAPIAIDSALPRIVPDTPGHWTRPNPATLRFDPDVAFVPDATFTLEIPQRTTSTNGGTLATEMTVNYRVADGSLLRLQQLLAELSYLPLSFEATTLELNSRRAQGVMAFNPPQGTFDFRFASTPSPLADLWQPGKLTAMTKGAVMAFEKAHGLDIDGVAGAAVWAALLDDATRHVVDPLPYTWAWTTMSRPETLRIWSDGEFVLSSKANTGIAAAPTPKGSWPVFARYRSQTMRGINPDGTRYSDPGVPYVSYFYHGDAIHGFKRASYGSPQSLGCVELPYDAAAAVWNLVDYGTVVTITS